MPNTIQIKLLENKRIDCLINGLPYAYEGGYRIVAGEVNATQFQISSVPKQYENATYSVTLTNSLGEEVLAPNLDSEKKFTLPVGMAIAGYGSILISAQSGNEKIIWTPLKIKVWNTNPNWNEGTKYISSPIQIGVTTTLPPDSQAFVENVGTPSNPVLNFYLPQGERGEQGSGLNIIKWYDNATDMQADYDNPNIEIGDTVGLKGNLYLYVKGDTTFEYIGSLHNNMGDISLWVEDNGLVSYEVDSDNTQEESQDVTELKNQLITGEVVVGQAVNSETAGRVSYSLTISDTGNDSEYNYNGSNNVNIDITGKYFHAIVYRWAAPGGDDEYAFVQGKANIFIPLRTNENKANPMGLSGQLRNIGYTSIRNYYSATGYVIIDDSHTTYDVCGVFADNNGISLVYDNGIGTLRAQTMAYSNILYSNDSVIYINREVN